MDGNREIETRGPALLYAVIILSALGFIFTLLRLYTRLFIQKWFGPDDAWILVSLILMLSYSVVVVLGEYQFYWNRHIRDIPLDAIGAVMKSAYANVILFICVSFTIRSSFLCLYRRLFENAYARTKYWLYGLWIYTVIISFVSLIMNVFICRPIYTFWVFPRPEGSQCFNGTILNTTMGIINCTADFAVVIFPIPFLYRLKLPIYMKLATGFLLCLGFIAAIAGVLRVSYTARALGIASGDVTWEFYPLWFSAVIEIDLAIICASGPALRPFFTKFIMPAISRYGQQSNLSKSSDQAITPKGRGDFYSEVSDDGHNLELEDTRNPSQYSIVHTKA